MQKYKFIQTTLSIAILALTANAARAEATQAEVDRLGKDLTPNGAIKAGNKEGTIPEWTGGMTKPPAGWKPEQGYVDPFAGEKPLFVITEKNAAEYKDKLSAGMLAMILIMPCRCIRRIVLLHCRSLSMMQPGQKRPKSSWKG